MRGAAGGGASRPRPSAHDCLAAAHLAPTRFALSEAHGAHRLRWLERLRRLEHYLIAPAIEPGEQKAFFVSGGAVSPFARCRRRPGRGSRSKPGSRLAVPPANVPATR